MPRTTSVSKAEFAAVYHRMRDQKLSDAAIARELGISNMTVLRWKKILPELMQQSAQVELPVNTPAVSGEHAFSSVIPRPGRSDHPRVELLEKENALLRKLLAEQLLQTALAREGVA